VGEGEEADSDEYRVGGLGIVGGLVQEGRIFRCIGA
jgi:hypothetical protein